MPEDGVPPNGRCIAILDTETSGLNVQEDKLIELAILLVWVDDDGEITGHMGPVSWLQDPGVELEPEITLITGLANHHLVGKQIDDTAAFGFLDRADLLVAQNAKFDLAWIEQRYPGLKGKAWACSCSEINWLKLGYEGRSQQHLLWQHGWFTNAHRAEADVWSLFWLLQQRQRGPGDSPVQSHLQRLLQAADMPIFKPHFTIFNQPPNGWHLRMTARLAFQDNFYETTHIFGADRHLLRRLSSLSPQHGAVHTRLWSLRSQFPAWR